jgi:hypothetical protein
MASNGNKMNLKKFLFSAELYIIVVLKDTTSSYPHLWEALKDSWAFCGGYYRIKDVVYGIQNAYQAYETEVLGMEAEVYTS